MGCQESTEQANTEVVNIEKGETSQEQIPMMGNHNDSQPVNALQKGLTMGPQAENDDLQNPYKVGEPEVQSSRSVASNNANATPLHFNLRDSGDIVKVSASENTKQVTRQSMIGSEEGWSTVQVGNNLFQAQDATKNCRWVNHSGVARQSVAMNGARSQFAMCKLDFGHVFALGGDAVGSCERFDVVNNIWEAMPSMSVARGAAGACAMNGTVYVFCGITSSQTPLNSVEYMINAGGPLQGMSQWQTVNFSEASLFPRWCPAVSMLNSSEIVIMGGNSFVDDEFSSFGDVFIFNTENYSIERKVQNFAGLLQFQAVGNKCAQFTSDSVIAVVEDEEQSKTMVIEFKKGTKIVKLIQNL